MCTELVPILHTRENFVPDLHMSDHIYLRNLSTNLTSNLSKLTIIVPVGTSGRDRKRAIQRLSQAAERASSWLWLRREEMSWKQSTNAQ